MSCEQYTDWIGDAVDGTLDPASRSELDTHCAGCEACRALLDDLRAIREAAASLDRATPPAATWDAIAAKIHGTERHASQWFPLAAAAALVLALGTAAWFGAANVSRERANEAHVELARTAASELQLAEQHYLNAIASLEQLTVQQNDALDPAIAAEIAESLKTIDRAIDDSRAALAADPRSFVAQTSLLEALRMKVAVLQETVSLMNARS